MPKKNRSRNRSSSSGSGRRGKAPGHSSHETRSHDSRSHKDKPSGGYEVLGIVQANEKGFGFLIPQDGSPDAFIPPHQMRDIMNGDTIKARVMNDPRKAGKFIAETLSIEKRAYQS